MQSITIHGLEERLAKELKKIAQHEKQSLNKTVKKVIEKGLGLEKGKKGHRTDFLDLFGVWNHMDEEAFSRSTAEFETIFAEDWQ
jgi:hypothetical protein